MSIIAVVLEQQHESAERSTIPWSRESITSHRLGAFQWQIQEIVHNHMSDESETRPRQAHGICVEFFRLIPKLHKFNELTSDRATHFLAEALVLTGPMHFLTLFATVPDYMTSRAHRKAEIFLKSYTLEYVGVKLITTIRLRRNTLPLDSRN